MTHRHPQAPPGHFEVHIVLNPTADRAAAHHSHVSKKIDCMLQLEFGLIDEEYMFFLRWCVSHCYGPPHFAASEGAKPTLFGTNKQFIQILFCVVVSMPLMRTLLQCLDQW